MKAELMNAGIIRAVLSRIQLEEVPYDIALRCMLILRNLTKGDPHCSKTMSKFQCENKLLRILTMYRDQ